MYELIFLRALLSEQYLSLDILFPSQNIFFDVYDTDASKSTDMIIFD